MKIIFLILVLMTVVASVPTPIKLISRNLFKKSVKSKYIKVLPRIIGGQEAEPHSIPYQVFLEIYSETEGWYCGGSLISESVVLTAAHCIDGGVEAHVTLGAHKPLQVEDTQVKLVSKDLTKHEYYNSDLMINDIGIIKLHESIKFSDAIQAVTLPSSSEVNNTFAGETARISGWGLTDGYGNRISDVLNYVDVDVITVENCEAYFGKLPTSTVCTSGDQNSGSCNGDAGGPLVIDGKQIGIVSYGVTYCLAGFPSVFTRITTYLNWIKVNSKVNGL